MIISESATRRLTAHHRSPDFISLRYIAECGLSGSKGQAHNLNNFERPILGPCLGPQACVRLRVEPTLFAFSKTVRGKEVWGIIIEMLV